MITLITQHMVEEMCAVLMLDFEDVTELHIYPTHVEIKGIDGLHLEIPVEGHKVPEPPKQSPYTSTWTANSRQSTPWDIIGDATKSWAQSKLPGI